MPAACKSCICTLDCATLGEPSGATRAKSIAQGLLLMQAGTEQPLCIRDSTQQRQTTHPSASARGTAKHASMEQL
jgi:hypothetical protein